MPRSWLLLVALAACVSRETYLEAVRERDRAVDAQQEATRRAQGLEAEVGRLRQDVDTARARAAAAVAEARRVEARALRERLGLGPTGRLSASIVTELGEVRCELWPEVAPLAVDNFVALAEGTRDWRDPRSSALRTGTPLYPGTTFHRVIKGFMIQGGDPKGDGSGGPGYTFRDEVDPEVTFSEPGVLAMANAGPDTNGSQFFVTSSAQTQLNGKHTIFGRCDTDVVEKIMAEPLMRDPENPSAPPARPAKPVRIERVVISRRP